MQFHQLRYLVAVAGEGGFSRAARTLQVAQPSVSAAVRALERELGTELFHRAGAEVTVTAAGEALLPWARQALADCDAGRAAVGDLLGLRQGRVALGATPSLTTGLLVPLLAEFHRQYPGLTLSVHESGSRNLVAALERGELDLAVVILPVAGSWVLTEALTDEALVLAVPGTHPFAGRSSVEVAALEALPLVMFREGYDLRESTVAACRSHGFTPTVAVDGLEMDGVLALAAAGLGAAVVPISVLEPGGPLVGVPFLGGDLRRTIGLASRRDRTPAPASRALSELLRRLVTAAG